MAEVEQQHEEARPDNSILVSVERNPIFYAQIGKYMFNGRDGKDAFDEIIITGLGMAIKTAIGTASLMQKDNQARISKVETSYYSSTRGQHKMVPKITIICTKTANFVPEPEKVSAA